MISVIYCATFSIKYIVTTQFVALFPDAEIDYEQAGVG